MSMTFNINGAHSTSSYVKFLLLPLFSFFFFSKVSGQCQFTVSHNASGNYCLIAAEEVVWSKTGFSSSLSASGNNLTKAGGVNGTWDAGAISVNTVKNNGWLQTTVNETNKLRAIGLSTSDGGVGVTTIQYAFQIRGDLQVDVYDPSSGTSRTTFAYATGDILIIAIENNVVKYYSGTQLKYTSSVAPTLPLIVDVSMNTTGATLQSVKVFNRSNGTFTASAPIGDLGAAPFYQWYLNGSPIGGATTNTYTNTALTGADQLYCRLIPGAGGCSVSSVNSNTVQFQILSASSIGSYFISNTPAAQACLGATEDVIGFNNKVNVSVSGNDLTKTSGATSGSWDTGASSIATVVNNGYVETTIAENNKGRAFGLSTTDTNLDMNTIQFAFYFRSDNVVEIYQSGTKPSDSPAYGYSTNQVYKIAVEDGVVKYYRAGVLIYISSVSPTLPLLVDISFNDTGGTINDVVINNGSLGTFTSTASITGASPTYQWKRNGINVGTATTYTNTLLTNGDLVNCVINPDLVGCASVTSPNITISDRSFGGTFYINNLSSVIACASTQEQIQPSDKINVVAVGNNLTKVQGGSGFWNAGATSLNQVLNNGYAETTVAETTTTRIFGLSTDGRILTHTSSAESKIQFGIFFFSNAHYWVGEFDGTTFNYRGDFGTYLTGEVFRIKVDNGTVRYYKGSTNFYSSALTPTLPLVVDVSFNDVNATLNSIVVSNGCSGVFNATTNNAGASPTYQWTKNGASVGTNSATYSSSLLSAGDVVSCSLLPDLAGCNITQASNLITVDIIGGASSPSTIWTGASSTAWENSSNWSNGIPTGYVKVSIPSGTPRNPTLSSNAGAYDVTVQSGAALTISGSNSLTVFNQLSNQGTFTQNTSKVSMKNCTNNTNSLTAGTGNTFYDLEIINPYNLNFSGNTSVSNNLTLTSGILSPLAASDMIIIRNNASVTGGSSGSHVNGKIKKIGNSAFAFPVGKQGIYRPISITSPSVNTDEFVAEYFFANQSFGGSIPAGIWTLSGCEYWNLERIVGSSQVQVTLSWVSADCDQTIGPYVTNPATLLVVGFDGTNWKNWGNSSASGTTSGTVTNATPIASYFGPFTLASLTSSNALPIELGKFELYRLPHGINLKWTTFSELESDYFQIERSANGLDFQNVGTIAASGNSQTEKGYSYLDRKPSSGNNYYRLKLVDYNGKFSYSELKRVNFDGDIPLMVVPNPAARGEDIQLIGGGKRFWILNPVSMEKMEVSENTDRINTEKFVPGVYVLIDESNSKYRFVIK
jgi:hypothetical protein